ncbi:hypothetical protein [Actinoplanes sp. HUAS TT8]|uniref:hypothetical protein n=1 Tax=Actinoplanes sp. HUAS TT8 TaxID=3447453 RepID=UPI003F520E8C
MPNEPRRLSTGSTTAARIIGAVFGLVFASFGVLFAAGVLFTETLGPFGATSDCVKPDDVAGLPPELLPDGLDYCGSWLPDGISVFGVVAVLAGGFFALVGLLIVLASLRGSAAWLDGASLRVRRTFGTRTVDLSTADVTAGIVTHTSSDETRTRVRRVPTLIARDPATGRKVTLALQGTGLDRLPPPELRALADAITINRPESDVDAYRIAQQLREMADNPLELHR